MKNKHDCILLYFYRVFIKFIKDTFFFPKEWCCALLIETILKSLEPINSYSMFLISFLYSFVVFLTKLTECMSDFLRKKMADTWTWNWKKWNNESCKEWWTLQNFSTAQPGSVQLDLALCLSPPPQLRLEFLESFQFRMIGETFLKTVYLKMLRFLRL